MFRALCECAVRDIVRWFSIPNAYNTHNNNRKYIYIYMQLFGWIWLRSFIAAACGTQINGFQLNKQIPVAHSHHLAIDECRDKTHAKASPTEPTNASHNMEKWLFVESTTTSNISIAQHSTHTHTQTLNLCELLKIHRSTNQFNLILALSAGLRAYEYGNQMSTSLPPSLNALCATFK